MNETRVIYLCGNRIGIPVMRDLLFSGQLAALVIPVNCTEFIAQAQTLLKQTAVPIILVNHSDCEKKLIDAILEYKINIGIVFTFSFRITPAVYDLPLKGFYNIHPGALPAYRGPDPIFRQIANRETYAVVTIHKLDDGMDSGPIVMSERLHLKSTDTHGILTTRLSEAAPRLLATLLKLANLGLSIPSREQDHSKALYYKRQNEKEVSVNWIAMDAEDIIALIHACNPWNKGAVTFVNNCIIRLLEGYVVSVTTDQNYEPGTIISLDNNGLVVAARNGKTVCVSIIYTEEGFLPAERLAEKNIIAGMRFMA